MPAFGGSSRRLLRRQSGIYRIVPGQQDEIKAPTLRYSMLYTPSTRGADMPFFVTTSKEDTSLC
jgi:hypothetical protein